MLFSRLLIVALSSMALLAPHAFADSTVLTDEQNLWLDKRNRTILVRPERNNPPFVFVPSGSAGRPQGIAVDYLTLILERIDVTAQYFEATSKVNILQSLKEGKDGVVLAMTQTDDRSQYLYFTKPFITVPAVIVVRKDAPTKRGQLTLADFTGKRISLVEGSAVDEYINKNYKKVIIEPVVDDEVGLQKLLLGEVDAAVIDLVSLSYYTANKALSYVVVGGQTGFEYNFSFGVPKHLPELATILDNGVQALTPQEQAFIKEKWITVSPEVTKGGMFRRLLENNVALTIGIVMAGVLVFLIGAIAIMRALRKTQLMSLLGRDRRKDTEALHQELKELEEASKVVSEELSQIKQLEQDIAEKIKEIK